MLHHKEAESIVRGIVANILDNVRTPERVRSPVGFYMTEQEQFQQNNPDVWSSFDDGDPFFHFRVLALLWLWNLRAHQKIVRTSGTWACNIQMGSLYRYITTENSRLGRRSSTQTRSSRTTQPSHQSVDIVTDSTSRTNDLHSLVSELFLRVVTSRGKRRESSLGFQLWYSQSIHRYFRRWDDHCSQYTANQGTCHWIVSRYRSL